MEEPSTVVAVDPEARAYQSPRFEVISLACEITFAPSSDNARQR